MSEWQLMSEIVRTILIMSVAGSVLTLLLFAVKPLMKNRLPKSVQYYLWVFVLVALLVPFSAFVSVPVSTPMAPVQEIIEANVKSTAEWQEELAQEQYNMPYEELDTPEQIEISLKEIGLMKGKFNNHILISLIALGGTVFLIEIVEYFIFVIRLRRRRLPVKDHEAALLQRLCKNRKPPCLYHNPLAPTPMLIGILRPAIYLPDMEYSEVQLRNILLHELTHLRRHDVIVKWFASLAVHLHWFNPIVYFMCREIDRACELACDEAVIKNLDTNEKQKYGDTLIAVVAEKKLQKTIMSTTMCEEKKALKTRLGAIMKHKRFSVRVIAFSCVLAAAVLCGTVVLGASALKESAADVLFRTLKNEAAVVRPESIIEQVDLDDGSILIFYYNANGNSACAVMEQGVFNYKIATTSAELSIDGFVPAQIMAGQYNNGDNWRVWGILRDNTITKALIYGQEAAIIEADGLRFCFILGEGRIQDNDDFQFFDAAGNLVWEISQSKELTIYVWKDRSVINYALFSGYKAQQSSEEVYSGENVFKSLDALNIALSDYPFDYLQLHIAQMNLSDFSKDEMTKLAEQIEIPVGNYSCSIGYFDK